MQSGPPPPPSPPWAIGHTTQMWEPTGVMGRRQARLLRREYQSALPAHIRSLTPEISTEAQVAASEATQELTRFDTEIGIQFAPFSALLLRSESAASSQIERLTASAKAVLLAESGDPSRRNANLITANTAAMRAAISLADTPTADNIIEMHRCLLEGSQPHVVGQWRQQAVWIGGSDLSPHDATFVPPDHALVPELIDDLVAFMRRPDLDPFVQAMVAHAQFETIHPFPDGNGRTGRALIHTHLRHADVARHVTTPISAGLLASTDRYFAALSQYQQGDLSPLVLLAAASVWRATDNSRKLAHDVATLTSAWDERLAHVRSDSTTHLIVQQLPTFPVLTAARVQERFSITERAANRAISHLVDAGVITQTNRSQRGRVFLADGIADALDRFADRAGRRTTP